MPTSIVSVPNDDAVRDRIDEILAAEAREAGAPFEEEAFAFDARDGEVWIGGLAGYIFQGWMCIHLMAVAAEARRTGIGTRLVSEAERMARQKGLTGVWLDTFSFQAPGFYLRLGYEVLGRIPDCQPGHSSVFMAKRLDGHSVSPGAVGE